jgi:glutamate synthase domain-containing protein 1
VLGWRDVPINPEAIGHDARAVMPRIRQTSICLAVPKTVTSIA